MLLIRQIILVGVLTMNQKPAESLPESFARDILQGYRTPPLPNGEAGTIHNDALAKLVFDKIPQEARDQTHRDFLNAVANKVPEENAKRGVAQRLLSMNAQVAVAYSRMINASELPEDQKTISPLDVMSLAVYSDLASKFSMKANPGETGFPDVDYVIERANQETAAFVKTRFPG